ncbi:hypothetical protein GQ42DRAFT_104561, partial [Ramicandelaber brevisporus]
SRKKTLILDLDETLIHATSINPGRKYHFRVEVNVDQLIVLYYVYKRPHVDYFLKKVSEWYNVVIFTASMREYADPVVDRLDPTNTLISGRLFRESCIQRNGGYVKDLRVVNPDLSQVCLIDNAPISYAANPENALPIHAWINTDPDDEALLDMLPFLDALRFTDDMRSVLGLR